VKRRASQEGVKVCSAYLSAATSQGRRRA
jgi:hypothetical protein